MLKHHNVARRSAVIAASLAIAAILPFAPASAKQQPPSGAKLYSVTMAVEGTDPSTFTFTFTNLPKSSAVIGSINLTVPAGYTDITLIGISGSRLWKASLTDNLIKLRASTDKQKLTPGQFITVQFTATVPTGEGTYTFITGAKSSRDFSGSPLFTRVGADPVLVVCPASGSCMVALGDTSDAQPGQQSGSVTFTDCGGCILTISSTPGDFCSETPPASCRSLFGPQFTVQGSPSGDVTFVVTCDFHDCPVIPEPTCSECSFSSADFYQVYFTDTNAPTNSGQTVLPLDDCSYPYPVAPCVQDRGRFTEGSGDYFSEILLEFSCGCEGFALDPRGMH